MPDKTIEALNETLQKNNIPTVPVVIVDDIAPEATRFHEYKKRDGKDKNEETWKKYKGAHFKNFYKFLAREYPNLLFEKDKINSYFLYQEDKGVYEELSDVYIKEIVTRLYVNEGFAQEGKVSAVLQTLMHFRSMFSKRGVILDDFDNRDDWFHCKNGWVNVTSAEFVEHSPKILSKRVANVDYVKDALCPHYDAMMTAFSLKDDQVRVLDQFSGLCLTGDISNQKMLVLLGRPGCGKSTIIETWRKVLGDLASSEKLTSITGDSARFIGSSLAGRTLIHFDEVSVRHAEMGGDISNLVSGGVIVVERKGVTGRAEVTNRAKCVLTANRLPSGQDGIFRRMILINFEKSFTDEKTADRLLPKKLADEKSGILNRMIRGLADLQKEKGFTAIDGHDELIEEYKESSDIIAEFLSEFFEPAHDVGELGVSSSTIFNTYKKWAEDNHLTNKIMITPQKFGKMLAGQPLKRFSHIQPKKAQNGVRTWVGIKIKKGFYENTSFEIICPDGSGNPR